ncbi:MAG TPA: rRNA adenine N-6-methyltransferase family protein, partial [Xanthobacteraceae bacterium]
NGMPSLWARIFDRLGLRPDARVLQVGAGTGYYTAVLAEIVGTRGRVTAVEADGELAERARRISRHGRRSRSSPVTDARMMRAKSTP